MKQRPPLPASFFSRLAALGLVILLSACSAPSERQASTGERVFKVDGVVKTIRPDGRTAVIQHEAIPGYMEAMTMPFRVKDAAELKAVGAGDVIKFRFHVTGDESWMDQVEVVRTAAPRGATNAIVERVAMATNDVPSASTNKASPHPLMTYKFTNQLGQAVSLADFRGTALAITFIFTRCPVPDYCPRLTKNFQETVDKLSALPNCPTNWHLLSFTIDPAWDTPRILKAYAERYRYNPEHWSFLTGPSERITDLVRESGVTVEPSAGLFSHNFRTLIVGTNGQLLTSIPIGGPISDGIVTEMLKALGVSPAQ
jgi:protein SCO1/2